MPVTKEVIVQQVQGITFAAKGTTNHWVSMDGPKNFGGSEGGSSPMELILMGLGGCTGMDVISILGKKKVNVRDFRIEITGEMADDYPKVYTRIDLKFVVHGKNIKEEDVKRAIELSRDKYCSVSNMLKQAVPVNYSWEVVNEDS